MKLMPSNVKVSKSNCGFPRQLRWRNPLPRDAKQAWAIMGSIVAAIWIYLLMALFSEQGLFRLFLLCFSVPMSVATITLLLLAIGATFGDRTESLTFGHETLTYRLAPAFTYLFFGEGGQDAERTSLFTDTLGGGIAAALSHRKSLIVFRADITDVKCDDNCEIAIGDKRIRVGANLDPDDFIAIANAIRDWKSGGDYLASS